RSAAWAPATSAAVAPSGRVLCTSTYRAIRSHLLPAAYGRRTTVPRPFRGPGWPGRGLTRTIPAMSTVAIQVLGRFSVAIDGVPISGDAWRSRRAADVVKLLALAPGHRMHRTEVMEALWPESDPEASGTNLRKALHFA